MRSVEITRILGGKVLETRRFYPTLLYFICLFLPILLLNGPSASLAAVAPKDPQQGPESMVYQVDTSAAKLAQDPQQEPKNLASTESQKNPQQNPEDMVHQVETKAAKSPQDPQQGPEGMVYVEGGFFIMGMRIMQLL